MPKSSIFLLLLLHNFHFDFIVDYLIFCLTRFNQSAPLYHTLAILMIRGPAEIKPAKHTIKPLQLLVRNGTMLPISIHSEYIRCGKVFYSYSLSSLRPRFRSSSQMIMASLSTCTSAAGLAVLLKFPTLSNAIDKRKVWEIEKT